MGGATIVKHGLYLNEIYEILNKEVRDKTQELMMFPTVIIVMRDRTGITFDLFVRIDK